MSTAGWQRNCDLLIATGERSKRQTGSEPIRTPWALNVVIPNGTALLVTSGNDRRVVLGPGRTLLEWKEIPQVLRLSTSTPKSDEKRLETCFLQVQGNFVSDVIDVETSDHVTLSIPLSLNVNFEGTDKEERVEWFNVDDYVKLLCDRIGSIIRSRARGLTLADLYPKAAEHVRDWILGVKPESGKDGEQPHRPGLFFEENSMRVIEVDVGEIKIPDETVRLSLVKAYRNVAVLEIGDTEAEAILASAKLRAELDQQHHVIEVDKIERKAASSTKQREVDAAISKLEAEKAGELKEFQEELASTLAEIVRERDDSNATAKLDREKAAQAQLVLHATAMSEVQKAVVAFIVEGDVKRLEALNPRLVAALEGLGDKQVLATIAENLPEGGDTMATALGLGGFGLIRQLVAGTAFADRLDKLGGARSDLDNLLEKREPVGATTDGGSKG